MSDKEIFITYKSNESRTERIKRFEKYLNDAKEVLAQYETALERFIAVQPKIDELERYYTSEEWRSDFEADERGELPDDLPRGVLSEDGIDELLDLNDYLISRGEDQS